ncbi:MAG: NAD(P)/FAD-dependent oxidoreductase [Candidatus Pelagibacter sp. TMED239]|nr:MAG: NAD(P)/FAD-dependent oxidoreductase [Candidatus Pelagibacter sp. TMED239]|tara:strand:+ start:3350 stop:4438 length:1089 start_codon:yes stop_codon:yes gene_type:complete
MKQKIGIVGGGLFGITVYLVLKKKGYDCTLFEKNSDILKGASTNNLNRVHFGYHYPRDNETAEQSLKGYKSFKKFYSKSILRNFNNYYFIAKGSKVNFKDYLKFCSLNNLKFKKLDLKKLPFLTQNILGGIKVNEPIYDWSIIRKEVKKKIKKLYKNKIKLGEKVLKISKNKNFTLKTNKRIYKFDKIIDASYEGSNRISNDIVGEKKLVYQITIIYEFISKDFKKMGLALMDGNYFSFLPKGKSNKHLLYHVTQSVLKQKKATMFPTNWGNKNFPNKLIKSRTLKILNDIKKYFPSLSIKISKKIFLSTRVLPSNQKKTDKRISRVFNIDYKYFQISSAKVDHSVDMAYEVLNKLKKSNRI